MKSLPVTDAVAMIPDGARIMVGGFLSVGTPERLMDEILRQKKHDLTIIAKRVIVAMQNTSKGRSKIVKACTLPITSARPVDCVVTELAFIRFENWKAFLAEAAPGVTVDDVMADTEANLFVADELREMQL